MLCLWPLRKACAAGGLLESPAMHCLACSSWAQPHLQSFACPPLLVTCEVAAGLCQGADPFEMISESGNIK